MIKNNNNLKIWLEEKLPRLGNLNKIEKKLALKSALSNKFTEDKVFIIDSFELKSFKTKELFFDLKLFDLSLIHI